MSNTELCIFRSWCPLLEKCCAEFEFYPSRRDRVCRRILPRILSDFPRVRAVHPGPVWIRSIVLPVWLNDAGWCAWQVTVNILQCDHCVPPYPCAPPKIVRSGDGYKSVHAIRRRHHPRCDRHDSQQTRCIVYVIDQAKLRCGNFYFVTVGSSRSASFATRGISRRSLANFSLKRRLILHPVLPTLLGIRMDASS